MVRRSVLHGITPGIQTLARYHYIGQFFQNSVLVFRCLTVTSDTIVVYLYDRYKKNESSSYTKQMGHGDVIYNLLFDSILIAI